MGILDFDNDEILAQHGIIPAKKNMHFKRDSQLEENFEALQDMGRKENSKDFSDSPHADRAPEDISENLDRVDEQIGGALRRL